MKWGDYWDKLFDLVRDVRRLGAGEGQALMRTERTDVLAKDMYAINRRIDESLATLEKNMKTPEEADVARLRAAFRTCSSASSPCSSCARSPSSA